MNQFEYDEMMERVFVYPEGCENIVAVFHSITAIEQDISVPNRWRLKSNLRTVATLWDCERKGKG